MSFSYANPTSDPSAGGIGWFNFGSGFVITPGQTYTGLTGTLNGGYTVTFDLSSTNISGNAGNFTSRPMPVSANPYFGNAQYTGTPGMPVLWGQNLTSTHSITLTVNNIVVTDRMGNLVPDFSAILADAECTGLGEVWTWTTDGGNWSLFDTIGSPFPTLAGIGSTTATITGNASSSAADYLLATTSPTVLTMNYTVGNQSSVQAVALGFAVTSATNATHATTESVTFTTVLGDEVTDTIVNAAVPNGITASGTSNTVNTVISNTTLTTHKSTDKAIAYIGDVITYQVAVTNTGNTPAGNVILTDPVPNGTVYVVGSLAASVAFTGSPMTTIHLTNSLAASETVSLSYQVQVRAIPNPNPIPNTVYATFTYTVNPLVPYGVDGASTSNTVRTVVFRNNYSQEISDLIHSIALEEAAIGNIANAEGAKIQRMLAMGATPNELLCVNKSVSDMLEALVTLESVLKQKLSAVDCQINPTCLP